MKLKRFLLRYYPPGIILEYETRDREKGTKEIDLLALGPETDVEALINEICAKRALGHRVQEEIPQEDDLEAHRKAAGRS
jgi:hypothetical protein